MAFYTAGTISVENNSTAITGSNLNWLDPTRINSGDVLYVNGAAYPILSADNATTLTLLAPYVGASASGLSYAIGLEPASIRDVASIVSATQTISSMLTTRLSGMSIALASLSGNVYNVSVPGVSEYRPDSPFLIKIATTNASSSPFLSINGLAQKPLYLSGASTSVVPGEALSGAVYQVVYDQAANSGAGAFIAVGDFSNLPVKAGAFQNLSASQQIQARTNIGVQGIFSPWTRLQAVAFSSSGTLGANTSSVDYLRVGQTVAINLRIQMTQSGGSGFLGWVPPIAPKQDLVQTMTGRENMLTGKVLTAFSSNTVFYIHTADYINLGVSGYDIAISGVYQAE